MTPDRFRSIVDKLDLSLVGASKFLGVDSRTVRRWANGHQDVPLSVEMLLELMAKSHLKPNELRRKLRMPTLEGLNNPVGNPNLLALVKEK